jgi:very-short-patch-repair endonuclease
MIDPQVLEFAKTMRSNATDAEHLMWQLLRAKRFYKSEIPSSAYNFKC